MASRPAREVEVEESGDDQEEEELECLGWFQDSVVGIQYYNAS